MSFTKSLILKSLLALVVCLTMTGCSDSDDAKSKHSHFYEEPSSSSTVYITPNGECYHSTPHCRTLSRSHTIEEVDIDEVDGYRRPCKVCY